MNAPITAHCHCQERVAERSESKIFMIAGGNHTLIHATWQSPETCCAVTNMVQGDSRWPNGPRNDIVIGSQAKPSLGKQQFTIPAICLRPAKTAGRKIFAEKCNLGLKKVQLFGSMNVTIF